MTNPQETVTPEDTLPTGADATGIETPEPQDNAPPVKRGRGRPPKNATTGQPAKETPTGTAPKRGRPAGKSKRTYTPDDISVMGRQLVGIHKMLVMVSGIPELMIADEEGQMLAQGIIGVADQYDLELDGKTGAALQLLATAAMVYGPRALAIRARAMHTARSQEAQPSTEVQ